MDCVVTACLAARCARIVEVLQPSMVFGGDELLASCRRVHRAEATQEGTLLLRVPAETYMRCVAFVHSMACSSLGLSAHLCQHSMAAVRNARNSALQLWAWMLLLAGLCPVLAFVLALLNAWYNAHYSLLWKCAFLPAKPRA